MSEFTHASQEDRVYLTPQHHQSARKLGRCFTEQIAILALPSEFTAAACVASSGYAVSGQCRRAGTHRTPDRYCRCLRTTFRAIRRWTAVDAPSQQTFPSPHPGCTDGRRWPRPVSSPVRTIWTVRLPGEFRFHGRLNSAYTAQTKKPPLSGAFLVQTRSSHGSSHLPSTAYRAHPCRGCLARSRGIGVICTGQRDTHAPPVKASGLPNRRISDSGTRMASSTPSNAMPAHHATVDKRARTRPPQFNRNR